MVKHFITPAQMFAFGLFFVGLSFTLFAIQTEIPVEPDFFIDCLKIVGLFIGGICFIPISICILIMEMHYGRTIKEGGIWK